MNDTADPETEIEATVQINTIITEGNVHAVAATAGNQTTRQQFVELDAMKCDNANLKNGDVITVKTFATATYPKPEWSDQM